MMESLNPAGMYRAAAYSSLSTAARAAVRSPDTVVLSRSDRSAEVNISTRAVPS